MNLSTPSIAPWGRRSNRRSGRNRCSSRNRRTAACAIALAGAIALRTGAAAAAPSPPVNPLPVPFYSQYDPHWSRVRVGDNQDVPMWSMGSLLTCMAMVAAHFPIHVRAVVPGTPPSLAASPDYIHIWLHTFLGYKRPSDPKTVTVRYEALGSAFLDAAGGLASLRFARESWPAARTMVDVFLESGDPTILFVQPAPRRYHPVVVVGWDHASASYLVLDPSETSSTPRALQTLYGPGWAGRITGALAPILSSPNDPGELELVPLLEVSAESPVELSEIDLGAQQIVSDTVELSGVDPDGRRIGWDPATGASVIEVSGAAYLPEPVWADPTGYLPDRAPGRLLSIERARPGRYRFEMIATGDGPFTLNARVQGRDHTILVDEGRSGTVAAGDVLKFQIEYSETGPSGFTVGDNFSPEANAGGARAAVVGTSVAFDAGASFDIDGSIVAHAWDFGDGATASGPAPAHAYAATGTYTATLTVSDDKGATGTAAVVVSVYPDEITEGTTERASITPSNTEPFGSSGSFLPSLSADGRFVAFLSRADNMGAVPHATYVRDRQMGTTEAVSTPECTATTFPVLSADAHLVVYECAATDPAWQGAVVASDRGSGADERIDVSPSGAPGACAGGSYCHSARPAVSEDGRFVAFVSDFDNLVPGDTNDSPDVFVRDRATGTTERVSLTDAGAQSQHGASTSSDPRVAISADGRFVAFASAAVDLVPGLLGFIDRVFVRDRLLERTEQVTVRSDGTFSYYTNGFAPSISADGRFVAFQSGSNELVPGDTNGVHDVFVRDRETGSTERVSLTGAGAQAVCHPLESNGCNRDPVISRDGRVVAFRSRATNLVFGDSNDRDDVFVRDLAAGTTELMSKSSAGEIGDGNSGEGASINDVTTIALSADGRFVAFCSDATNLIPVPTDGNGIEDIYVRDRQAAGLIAVPSGPYLGWASSAASPAAIAFDASGSLHPHGHAMVARWDFGDGSPVAEVQAFERASHAYTAAGTYTVTLVVSDGTHESPAASTTAEIFPVREPSLTIAPACGDPDTTVLASVEGYPLVPPDAGWNLGAGPAPALRAAHPGDHVRVRVASDGGGTSDEIVPIDGFTAAALGIEFSTRFAFQVGGAGGSRTVTVPDEAGVAGVAATFVVPCPPQGNAPPQAAVGGPYEGTAGVPVLFDGLDSSDPEGDPLTYRWFFEGGGTAEGQLPAYTFDAPGTYWVLLVVNDGELDSPTSVGTGSHTTVTIGAAPPAGPCSAVPSGATHASLECRLLSARVTTLESAAVSRMRNRMIFELDMARKRLDDSRHFCSQGNLRRARARVSAMRSWIDAYARRMRSRPAKTLVPSAAVRAELLELTAGMRADVNALRRAFNCPGQ